MGLQWLTPSGDVPQGDDVPVAKERENYKMVLIIQWDSAFFFPFIWHEYQPGWYKTNKIKSYCDQVSCALVLIWLLSSPDRQCAIVWRAIQGMVKHARTSVCAQWWVSSFISVHHLNFWNNTNVLLNWHAFKPILEMCILSQLGPHLGKHLSMCFSAVNMWFGLFLYQASLTVQFSA